ncbi:2-oxoglutarate dehydrogenase E1 component [Acetobacteraceae bacterium ESL0709]|nr:2-oxoglutarate dehydrogenase E1 component [Acetobacteraceae bacterium ESL0697]MDF7678835.1 2-oxoglutarate dehydrogenase E1 component [Acetobacteraceae bacterium ESL0709]
MSTSLPTDLLDDRDAVNSENIAYLSELHTRWQKNPETVDHSYATLFETLGDRPFPLAPLTDTSSPESPDESLKNAYRTLGHLQARLDPLGLGKPRGEADPAFATTNHTLATRYKRFYCQTVGAEFMHLLSSQERQWWIDRLETDTHSPLPLSPSEILTALIRAEGFEAYCQQRFPGIRRFGLEGGESLIPALKALISQAARNQVETITFGMPHRGRLNVMANILNKPLEAIFSEFAGRYFQPDNITVSGDVKYHLGTSTQITVHGQEMKLSLLPNPSHLEAIDPVVLGRVRALQDDHNDTERNHHMGVLIHGDAAFAGQGMIYEVLQLSQLEGYRTGGTIHIVVNNQIGFTTSVRNAHSGYWNTDGAKTVQAPILHVNGDDVEAVIRCITLAYEWQRHFKRDIVLDIQCYRRNGHNETDEASFTQPVMVRAIQAHPGIAQLYETRLEQEGRLQTGTAGQEKQHYQKALQEAFDRSTTYQFDSTQWFGDGPLDSTRLLDEPERLQPMTGVPFKRLQEVGAALDHVPSGFALHPRLKKLLEHRSQNIREGGPIDWATAEALAFGTIALDGHKVRLSGQDCGRGTFTQRHDVLTDQETGQNFTPLDHLNHKQGSVEIWNSPLSEYSILGYEYGYSIGNPEALVAWEAQFGDFANGAQIIIDQFLASGETKWLYSSGLTLLLPHGHEGAGPEHSSARPERFLQLCAENNFRICWPSTPANYFHALRRQIVRRCRKPLVIFSPKSLLRNPLTVSSVNDMGPQTRFQPVLADDVISEKAECLILCSGKVYYDLLVARGDRKDIALIRLEQLYPFPHHALVEILKQHLTAKDVIWCQEEPQNAGAWQFLDRRLERALHDASHPVTQARYVGRKAAAAPATGLASIHQTEQKDLVRKALSQGAS